MQKSGRAVAQRMRQWSKNGVTQLLGRPIEGHCLMTCRLAWDLPGDEESAILEWNSIDPSHKFKTRFSRIPTGFPIFWEGGKYGHVAIKSSVPGMVWSTDLPETGKIGLVRISTVKNRWGYKYLGWSDVFQNRLLPKG